MNRKPRKPLLANITWVAVLPLILVVAYHALIGPLAWAHGSGFIDSRTYHAISNSSDLYRGSRLPGSELYRRYILWSWSRGACDRWSAIDAANRK